MDSPLNTSSDHFIHEVSSLLIIADGSCPKIRELLAKALVPVLWLEAGQPPLETVTAALAERRQQGQPVQTLHWVSHGQPGVLQVGQKRVDRAALLAASDQLSHWQVDHIALWACDYGADSSTLSLWEELVDASVLSSVGVLGVNSHGRKNWSLHSKERSKTIDWPLNFGDSSTWEHQLATVSYATFSQGPQASDPLTSSEQITAVGYATSFANVDTNYVKPAFDAISDFNYTTYTDDYSFLDSEITADLVYIALPDSVPSPSQLDNLKLFIEGGGTLLINGEFSPNFDTQNANASQILAHVGSSIAVKQGIGTINDATLNATPPDGTADIIEIGNFDITSGLDVVKTGAFGGLEIDNQSAEAILVTSADDTNNIVMAREEVGSGNAIVFADVNMFQADNNTLFSNIIIQSKKNIAESAAPTPAPTPEPTPEPEPEPTPAPDLTPADPAPAGTNIQLTDDDGDGLKEVVTAADGALIDGNDDGIADAEQTEVAGLRMINDGAESTDYGALETDPALSFSAISFLSPTEPATDTTGTGSSPETYAVTTSDGQTQTTSIPSGIDNAFAGLLAFTVSGLSNGGSTSTTISLPEGLNTLNTAQLAYLRFNYATNRFEDFVDSAGTPLYSFKDSNNDGQLDSVVLQLTDGDPTWDGDGIANGSIIDPGFLAIGERKLAGNNKDNTLQGNVLANTLLGKKGNDTLFGDLGNDILIGHGKHDRLHGGEGYDNLKGKTGDDRLHGGDHDDRLNGGKGDDTLIGGKGDDTLIGGSGADRFRLSKGNDLFKDFSIGDGDQVIVGENVNLTITRSGKNLVLSDTSNAINTTLFKILIDELLSSQPDLFS